MKITIEPTGDGGTKPVLPAEYHHKVVIEHPMQDPGVEHALELAAVALIAYGYPEKIIREYIPEP